MATWQTFDFFLSAWDIRTFSHRAVAVSLITGGDIVCRYWRIHVIQHQPKYRIERVSYILLQTFIQNIFRPWKIRIKDKNQVYYGVKNTERCHCLHTYKIRMHYARPIALPTCLSMKNTLQNVTPFPLPYSKTPKNLSYPITCRENETSVSPKSSLGVFPLTFSPTVTHELPYSCPPPPDLKPTSEAKNRSCQVQWRNQLSQGHAV